ncbi:MAG: cellulase family glycosylhydrolase [Sandaracinaceae bacterium]|nr:cellulase family glycosylhydrolase [Sandaracinaceae bacterium]MBK8593932.1 cellulase family glycosylhydrolase [Sandaracinaceae bacterium]
MHSVVCSVRLARACRRPYVTAACSLALLAALLSPGCSDPAPRVDPTRFLVDDEGGALILHGTNVESAAKGSPDNLPVTFAEVDAEHMSSEWGFNFVRYLIFWSAIEPEMGMYNEAFLDDVEERLDWFAANGIHVLLDMHQDVYSTRFCCDGAPDWAIHAPYEDYEVNTGLWSFNYFTPEVQEAFDNFWGYEGEHRVLQDHYVAMWRHVAERFRDHPAVLGYDVMNEPYQGSDFDLVGLALRRDATPESALGRHEAGALTDFYQRVIDGIREVDRDNYIFFEPSYGSVGDGGPSFIQPLNDPRGGAARLVYAPHLYSFKLEAAELYGDEDDIFARWRAQREVDGERLQTPIVMGEWGLDMNFPGATRFVDELLQMSDEMMVGWAQWSWDPNGGWSMFDQGGEGEPRWVERPLLEQLVRTYPLRVAGEPVSIAFEPATAELRLVFESRAGVRGDTEIFVPRRRYPEGFEVVVSDEEGTFDVRRDDARQRVFVTTRSSGTHEVVVRRAAPSPTASRAVRQESFAEVRR